jgi:enoyl-CoA hydratase/carnithine racemase
MNDILESSQEGRLLRLWLNRPEKRNALTAKLCLELVHTLEGADRDAGVCAVLLAAKGHSFCAGMDLNELAHGDIIEISQVQESLFTPGARFRKPLICAVQGAALAAGTGIVANCHVVIASVEATFGLTEIRLGLWPFVIFSAVAAAVGERRAIALSLTGEILSATEALRVGLVHQVVPAGELEERSLELARTVANYSPQAIDTGLDFVRQVQGKTWNAGATVGRFIRDEFLKNTDFQGNLRASLNRK